MPANYTVTAVQGQRQWTGKHGTFVDYQIVVQPDGTNAKQAVTTTRKPDSPAPAIGEVIYGHLETEDIPKKDGSGTWQKTKLRREQRPDDARPSSSPSSDGPQAGGEDTGVTPNPGQAIGQAKAADAVREPLDERQRRIERQHSQEMALRALTLINQGVDSEEFSVVGMRDAIEEWTDWFANDLNSPQSPPSTGQPVQEDNGGGVQNKGDTSPPASLEAAVDQEVAAGNLVEEYDEF